MTTTQSLKFNLTLDQINNLKLWVEALESGEYQQCPGRLYDEVGSYCCLGVACRVFEKMKKEDILGNIEDLETSDLPYDVARAFGLKDMSAVHKLGSLLMGLDSPDEIKGFLDNEGLCNPEGAYLANNTFSSMNDDYNKDFPTIAKYIRNVILANSEVVDA